MSIIYMLQLKDKDYQNIYKKGRPNYILSIKDAL